MPATRLAADQPAASAAAWERRRHWFAPPAQRMLLRHTSAGGASHFSCRLAVAQHAYLWQHCVNGRPLLPGAAMLEAAYAGAATLLREESEQQAALQGAAVMAPLLLRPPTAASVQLSVEVAHGCGEVRLASQLHHGAPTVHLSAGAAALAAVHAVLPARQPSSCRMQLCSILQPHQHAASATYWRGEAVGSLCHPLVLPACDSYHCHPAVVDAATHFGAAFDLHSGSAPRVPVGLGSYTASAAGVAGTAPAQRFTISTAAQLQVDGSRMSSFTIAGAVSLGSLHSRPLGSKGAAGQPAAQSALASRCFSYQTQWQAAAALAPVGTASSQAPLLRLQADAGSVRVAAGAGLPQAALRSYAAALRMLQQGLRPGRQHTLTATVATAACQQGHPLASPASSSSVAAAGAAAVVGLLKVAAREEPAWQLGVAFVDPAAAVSHQATSNAVQPQSVHGAAAAASIRMQPLLQLTNQQPGVSTAVPSAGPASGCHVVSGGMGGLGALAALHLAEQSQQGTHLLLLGRSGCFADGLQQQELSKASSSVTLLAADVAAAADAAAVAAQLHLGGLPPASFLHTAGVLADSLLAQQQLADARRVAAPKLSGLAAVLPHLHGQPLRRLLLFSSVSATLGNRGQACYAAANAVLDAAAAALDAGGQAARSVQWGAWAGAGMAGGAPGLLARLERTGGWGWASGQVGPCAGVCTPSSHMPATQVCVLFSVPAAVPLCRPGGNQASRWPVGADGGALRPCCAASGARCQPAALGPPAAAASRRRGVCWDYGTGSTDSRRRGAHVAASYRTAKGSCLVVGGGTGSACTAGSSSVGPCCRGPGGGAAHRGTCCWLCSGAQPVADGGAAGGGGSNSACLCCLCAYHPAAFLAACPKTIVLGTPSPHCQSTCPCLPAPLLLRLRPAWTRWAPSSCASSWVPPLGWTCLPPQPLTTPLPPPWRTTWLVACWHSGRPPAGRTRPLPRMRLGCHGCCAPGAGWSSPQLQPPRRQRQMGKCWRRSQPRQQRCWALRLAASSR